MVIPGILIGETGNGNDIINRGDMDPQFTINVLLFQEWMRNNPSKS
jgi:hypothetical protein